MDLLLIIGPVILLFVVLGFVTYAIYFERKVLGWMQNRVGPNQVGPWGLLQTVADVLKLLIKEDVIPKKADIGLFKIAPILAFMPAFAVLAVMPFTDAIQFADIGVGLLYYLAISSITTIGILVGGWASNNKYALLGGMRSAAQMISYEIPLVMSVVGIVMTAQTLNLAEIVQVQQKQGWFIFPQFIGFIVFLIASIAELNRTPFDLPEAESELVAGYHVEYSGFRFAFFMLAEYVYIFAMASLTTVLYLGGWDAPFDLTFIPPIIWFILKFSFFVFLMYWLRATMPRIRADQLMPFAWKVLLPIALLNIFLTALFKEIPVLNAYF
jgi:NADH-quinone oxidoreductase subunit H